MAQSLKYMEDILDEIVVEFRNQVIRHAVQATSNAFMSFFRGSLKSTATVTVPVRNVGRNFYMRSNVTLWYNFKDSTVYMYSVADFGNRWVESDIPINKNPMQLGKVLAIDELYEDAYGNLYYGA